MFVICCDWALYFFRSGCLCLFIYARCFFCVMSAVLKIGFLPFVGIVSAVFSLTSCGGKGEAGNSLSGQVSGLAAFKSLVLQNNGVETLAVSASGAFTFSTPVPNGGNYAVTVQTQPAGQTCTVSNCSGTAIGNESNIAVSCANKAG